MATHASLAILFDDAQGRLSPLADLRPVHAIRTGALTTFERLSILWRSSVPGGLPLSVHVAEGLRSLAAERGEPLVELGGLASRPAVLLINARAVIPPDEVWTLPQDVALVEAASGHTIAACVSGVVALEILRGAGSLAERLGTLPIRRQSLDSAVLLSRPWHLRRSRDAALRKDLSLLTAQPGGTLLPSGVVAFGSHPIRIASGAKVYPGSTFDAEGGAIVIDADAVVRPGAILIGPCYVGPHATVLERATIRQNTAIGPWCKVNGEVGGTIFQGFANKAHDGYLGDSFVGEWANLGAGTTNSNLLNTYGEIITKAAPDASNERTGEQFLGATIGDHVKTAICTRLMTGCVLHTGGMFAQTAAVSGAVRPFTWATDAGHRAFRLEKFLEVMHAAMKRRGIIPGPAYLARVQQLHAAAAPAASAGAEA